ncbi:MAG: SPFH domain-containing protein, partial [Planctomycetota bacterium]
GPGLYFRLPYPIDDIRTYDKRVRIVDGPLAQTQLRDDWHVIISMYCAWYIAEPVPFQETLEGNVESAQERLKQVIFNETSRAVSDLTFNDLVSTDAERVNERFDDLEEEIMDRLRKSIRDKEYGLRVSDFGIRRIDIPEETTREVFERMRAEREKAAETYLSEGERRSQEIIAEAEKEAEEALSDAESEAKRIRSEGEAKEAEFYDVFATQPELAIFLRRLEALRTIARGARESGQPITFVLDPQTEPLSVLSRGPQQPETVEETDEEAEQEETEGDEQTDATGEDPSDNSDTEE